MAYNERTSARMATLAAKLMHHPDPEVRELAACALTQAPDRSPPKSYPFGLSAPPPGAHAYCNRLAGESLLSQYSLDKPLLTGVLEQYSVTAKST